MFLNKLSSGPAALPEVVSVTDTSPPTFKFSWVLIPPATLRAPVVTEVDVVVSVILTLSASTSSKLACVA